MGPPSLGVFGLDAFWYQRWRTVLCYSLVVRELMQHVLLSLLYTMRKCTWMRYLQFMTILSNISVLYGSPRGIWHRASHKLNPALSTVNTVALVYTVNWYYYSASVRVRSSVVSVSACLLKTAMIYLWWSGQCFRCLGCRWHAACETGCSRRRRKRAKYRRRVVICSIVSVDPASLLFTGREAFCDRRSSLSSSECTVLALFSAAFVVVCWSLSLSSVYCFAVLLHMLYTERQDLARHAFCGCSRPTSSEVVPNWTQLDTNCSAPGVAKQNIVMCVVRPAVWLSARLRNRVQSSPT